MDKNEKARRIAIIIAVILGLVLVLYLGGLLGQLSTGDQSWMEFDAFSEAAPASPFNFSFFFCVFNAFSEAGIKAIGLIIVAAGGILLYLKLSNKFSSNNLDDRNFTISNKGTYGTAAWMNDKEMKSVLEVTTVENAEGIILGKKNGKVICLPRDTHLNKHICVFGASGTMKSRAIVRPLIFQSIKNGESVVVTDPKGEIYNDTAELFKQNGYTVKVFNLVSPKHSDSWNCMADLEGDSMLAQILTDVIISNTSKGKVDHFWDNGEGNLLKSLVLYVDQDSTRGLDAKNLPIVYQLITRNTEKTLGAIFDKLPIDHPAKAPYSLFAQASDTVRTGIILGLGTRLQILQNEAIKKITTKSDIDLTEPGKNKCAYFVILSDQDKSTEFLSSLFFSFLFIKLTRYADSTPEGCCKIPVNIIFEELNNVGTLDSYPRRLSVARSRKLQMCHIVQSLAQFKNRYPDEQWAEIVGNCDTQIMLGCTETQTAELFSMRSGDMTVEVNSTMTTRQTLAVAQMIPQYRQTEGLGRRKLLTTDEVFRLPNEEMLVIIRGQKALKANKFDYTGHPYAKKMVKTSIYDYLPEEPKKKEIVIKVEDDLADEELEAEKNTAIPHTETEKNKKDPPLEATNLYELGKPPEDF